MGPVVLCRHRAGHRGRSDPGLVGVCPSSPSGVAAGLESMLAPRAPLTPRLTASETRTPHCRESKTPPSSANERLGLKQGRGSLRADCPRATARKLHRDECKNISVRRLLLAAQTRWELQRRAKLEQQRTYKGICPCSYHKLPQGKQHTEFLRAPTTPLL